MTQASGEEVGSVEELLDMDAIGQAQAVAKGQVKSQELVDACINRVEVLNPRINAVIHPLFDKARSAANDTSLADGPFKGVPLLLKDSMCASAGDPLTEGMKFLKELNWIEPEDSFLTQKFRAAGFVIIGKTNTPELAALPTTEPLAYGPTRNPWDPNRSTGGSSGGSAAAVASRMVAVAHGTDASGSIRLPASECGVVGLKPSRGRVSLGPDYSELTGPVGSRYVQHVLTRSVRDSAAVLDAISGAMPADGCVAPPPSDAFAAQPGMDPGKLRIGLLAEVPGGLVEVHPECRQAAVSIGNLLEDMGHIVEESHPKALEEQPEDPSVFGTSASASFTRFLDYWSRRTGKEIGPDDVEPTTWLLAEMGRGATAVQVLALQEWMQGISRRIASWWTDGFDLLLTPTLPELPPLLGDCSPTPEDQMRPLVRTAQLAMFTFPMNWTGQPAISLPLAWSSDGLPIGVQLAADYGREDLLFRVASQLEVARPWHDRRPPLSREGAG